MPIPPGDLLHDASLLLDLDGTLLELVDNPSEVKAEADLRALLMKLRTRLKDRVAVISGRSLEQIDAILGDAGQDLALSGSHGSEHRWNGVIARPDRPDTLDVAAERLKAFAALKGGKLLVEEKSFGVALHYRVFPNAEVEAKELAEKLGSELDLAVQHGKMVVELRVPGGDKGRAVHRLMSRPPMHGTRPVFIGDDLTDEPGFIAARELGGAGILIGTPRSSAADYHLSSPADLRAWLERAV